MKTLQRHLVPSLGTHHKPQKVVNQAQSVATDSREWQDYDTLRGQFTGAAIGPPANIRTTSGTNGGVGDQPGQTISPEPDGRQPGL